MDGSAVPLAGEHHTALVAAVAALENPNFATRLADFAGAPVSRVLAALPRFVDKSLTKAVDAALQRCLRTAIQSLDGKPVRQPRPWMSSIAAGVAGGVSGFMGLAALPVELPVTTTLMLRAVADIARHNGEDLTQLEARLACLQVFALGARAPGTIRSDMGYFSSRALLTRLSGNAAAYMVERGTAELTAPMVNKLMAEIVSRFSIVVSDRLAASAVPVIGAVGGATVNVIFMNHFQQVARGHFTIRRLERRYGTAVVRRHYAHLARQQAAAVRR